MTHTVLGFDKYILLSRIPFSPRFLTTFRKAYQSASRQSINKKYDEQEKILENGIIQIAKSNTFSSKQCLVLLQSALVDCLLKQNKETEQQIHVLADTINTLAELDVEVAASVLASCAQLVYANRSIQALALRDLITNRVVHGIVNMRKRQSFMLFLHLDLLKRALLMHGGLGEASKTARILLEWSQKYHGANSCHSAHYHSDLAFILAQEKNFIDSDRHFEIAKQIYAEQGYKHRTNQYRLLNNIGESKRLARKHEEARNILNESLQLQSTVNTSGLACKAETEFYLARVFTDQNDPEQALHYFSLALDHFEKTKMMTTEGKIACRLVMSEYINLLEREGKAEQSQYIKLKMQLLS